MNDGLGDGNSSLLAGMEDLPQREQVLPFFTGRRPSLTGRRPVSPSLPQELDSDGIRRMPHLSSNKNFVTHFAFECLFLMCIFYM